MFPNLHSHGPDESNEGDEGRSQRHDCKCSVQRCRRDDWLEGEGREGRHGGHRSDCRRRVEKEWFLQACGCVEPEAQEEACDASQERCEPIHERTMRLQSQASVQDRQGITYEEIEGNGELNRFCSELVSLISGRGGRTHQVFSFEHCIFLMLVDRGSMALQEK